MSSSQSDSQTPVQLWFAGPALQVEYDPQALSAQDRERESARLAGRNAHEWCVSRALRRRLPDSFQSSSLSHSDGHALWGVSAQHSQIGVDLERIRPVDEPALAELVTHEDEMSLLLALQGQARTRFFYRLWTLKEALVKAVRGDFPADMLKAGLRYGPSGAELAGPTSRVHLLSGQAVPDDIGAALSFSMQSRPFATHSTPLSSDIPLLVTGMGDFAWQGISAMIGEDWMMAAVWLAQEPKDKKTQGQQERPRREQTVAGSGVVQAWQALPGEVCPLTLQQAVSF